MALSLGGTDGVVSHESTNVQGRSDGNVQDLVDGEATTLSSAGAERGNGCLEDGNHLGEDSLAVLLAQLAERPRGRLDMQC